MDAAHPKPTPVGKTHLAKRIYLRDLDDYPEWNVARCEGKISVKATPTGDQCYIWKEVPRES